MPIDFHAQENRKSYATRQADASWEEAMTTLIDLGDARVADIGCGGGIYSLALRKLGAREVLGVDSSLTMIQTAKEQCSGVDGLSFQVGDATASGLLAGSVDVVFERALIHHLRSLEASVAEASRVLRQGGHLIIQDRTPEDIALPGSVEHIRGYFFECFPRLTAIEQGRRWRSEEVVNAMENGGFTDIKEITVWETRRTYQSASDLASDLRGRTGRSILHELNDTELEQLICYIRNRVPENEQMNETDRWTVWIGARA